MGCARRERVVARAKRGVYLTRLSIRNVKSYAGEQTLELTDAKGSPARWTLLLGDNGVGKTTLLECLARLVPVFNSSDASGTPDPRLFVEPAIAAEENSVIYALGRVGDLPCSATASFALNAILERRAPDVGSVETSIAFTLQEGKSEDLETSEWPPAGDAVPQSSWSDFSPFVEPLVLAYGAGRHMGVGNLDFAKAPDPTESLFNGSVELFDAEEVLLHFDYAASHSKATRVEKRQRDLVLDLVAALLPEVGDKGRIVVYPPRAIGRAGRTGVYVKTADGEVPLHQLSFGYQTMMAWAADIGWRLFRHYPESAAPLQEPAIVLIDEIDLHLHPTWQRVLRELLTARFPNVQFVATAHSPLIAQAFLDANLAVVRREGDHSVIENDPVSVRDWRVDQIVTSDLFGLASPWPPEIDALFREKEELLAAPLARAQQRRLREIDQLLLRLPTERDPADEEAFAVIREAARLLGRGAARCCG